MKTVPHGAGLGGGSGNAATALWAANELSNRPASNSDLLEWSAEIGSDISVFFSQGAAYCTGRGEIVENLEPPIGLDTPMLLVKPPFGLSTPQIFKALDLERRSTVDPLELLSGIQASGCISQSLCVNDLEQPAFDTLPELAVLKQKLTDTGLYESVFMTGSGSTIVCVGSHEVPDFVSSDASLFCSPTRLITRSEAGWYEPSRKLEAAV
jgi:4-diphosphocytidyl-2-C-methyl-D-erythritol kinase